MRSYKSMPFAAALLALSLSAQTALADDVVINLGYAAAEGSSYAVLADKFEELAEEYSGGTLNVKVRCCGQLMGEDEAFKAMQLGTVDMHVITGNNISNVNTPGYSRQVPVFSGFPSLNMKGFAVGSGSQVAQVDREHDAFLTRQIQEQSAGLGDAEAKAKLAEATNINGPI